MGPVESCKFVRLTLTGTWRMAALSSVVHAGFLSLFDVAHVGSSTSGLGLLQYPRVSVE